MKFNSTLAACFLSGVLMVSAHAALAVDTDPVVATVNGKAVHLTDIENARNLLPAELQNAPLKLVYPILLDSLINARLASDEAKELGFDETPEYLHRMAGVSDRLLQSMLLTRHIENKITDEMLQERYQTVIDVAKGKFEIHARHILVAEQAQANDLIAKLKDGDDFVKLAEEHSTGPSKERGGDLGWFGPGQMVAEFYDAALALQAGEFSQTPVQTKFGWHIILVEERRPFPVPSYQEAREVLANEISAEMGRKLMTQLRDKATIDKKSFDEVVNALQK